MSFTATNNTSNEAKLNLNCRCYVPNGGGSGIDYVILNKTAPTVTIYSSLTFGAFKGPWNVPDTFGGSQSYITKNTSTLFGTPYLGTATQLATNTFTRPVG